MRLFIATALFLKSKLRRCAGCAEVELDIPDDAVVGFFGSVCSALIDAICFLLNEETHGDTTLGLSKSYSLLGLR